jgi:hypothetical protein
MFDPGSTTHLFGTLKTEDQVGVPRQRTSFNPIVGGASELQFKYATYADIQELGLENVIPIAGELTLRIITPVSVTATEETLSTGEIPPGKRYVRIAFEAPLDESVRILVQRGDSVKEGDTLALRGLADIPKRKRELTAEQLSVLVEQRDVRLLEIDNRIAQCRQQLERDSSGWLLKRDLVRIGFSAPVSLADAEQSYDQAKQKLEALIESKRVLEKEYSVRILRLNQEIEGYTVKEHAAVEVAQILKCSKSKVYQLRAIGDLHAHGTMVAASGAPQRMVQSLMGHSDPRSTQIYVVAYDLDMRRAIGKLKVPMEGQKNDPSVYNLRTVAGQIRQNCLFQSPFEPFLVHPPRFEFGTH